MTSSESEADGRSSRKKIEIERKFVIGEDCQQRIENLGGKLESEEFLRDDYFDTLDYRLTLSDFWLRRRNGVWELKYPLVSTTLEANPTCRKYFETRDTNEILERASKIVTGEPTPTSVEDLVASKLHKFASIKSDRRSYSLDGLRIDLDATDFGFRLGELEICVEEGGDVAAAVSKIDQMAKVLGMKPYGTCNLTSMLQHTA